MIHTYTHTEYPYYSDYIVITVTSFPSTDFHQHISTDIFPSTNDALNTAALSVLQTTTRRLMLLLARFCSILYDMHEFPP